MNNYDRQEAIDELVAKYTPRELAGFLLDLEDKVEAYKDTFNVDLDEVLEDD